MSDPAVFNQKFGQNYKKNIQSFHVNKKNIQIFASCEKKSLALWKNIAPPPPLNVKLMVGPSSIVSKHNNIVMFPQMSNYLWMNCNIDLVKTPTVYTMKIYYVTVQSLHLNKP